MKKIIAAVSSLSLSLAMALPLATAVPTIAHADSAKNLVDLCKAAADQGYVDSVGACVSLPAKLCQQIRDANGFPIDLGNGTVLRNLGDCVNYVKSSV